MKKVLVDHNKVEQHPHHHLKVVVVVLLPHPHHKGVHPHHKEVEVVLALNQEVLLAL